MLAPEMNEFGQTRAQEVRQRIQQQFGSSGNVISSSEINRGLPAVGRLDRAFGADFGDVRVHYGSSLPAQLNALAFAQGSDIHVRPGQERHLAHEAWHVVQQRSGRVTPTLLP